MLEDYSSALLAGTEIAGEPFYRYLHALSLAHLNRWQESNSEFTQLRRSGLPNHAMWSRQDQLLDDEGNIKVVQGTVKESVDRTYLFVEQLQQDFYVARYSRWPPKGSIAFATIDFSYSGATAYPRSRN
jgi:hypothetical protein